MISALISFITPVALSCPISSAKSPVVINSLEASSFFSSSSLFPVASSKAFITPVSPPVPDTGNNEATTTLQESIPDVAKVLAIIELVTQVKFAVFTFIPLPDFVGSTYAQEYVLVPIWDSVAIPSKYFLSSSLFTSSITTWSLLTPKYVSIFSFCSFVRLAPKVTTLALSA